MRMSRKKIRRQGSSDDRATEYARAVVEGKIVAGPHVRNACRRHLEDLVHGPERGLVWDIAAAEDVFEFFEKALRLSEGQFEDQPFDLHLSQAFILGSLFGWKRADGRRRFRRAYIEQGKGNGKTPLCAGIGLYGLVADGEAGAQIYSAASKRDQAQVMFADAVKMLRHSPTLASVLEFSGGIGREFNIAYHRRSSFFRPVSKETGKTGSGPRPHFVLADEIHEMSDGKILEMLERGFKFRRQPLLVMITNSGSDRNSVCWHEHEWAVKVAAGHEDAVTDPTFIGRPLDDELFSYVCSLDPARTEVYEFDIAIRLLLESCTCNAKTTLIELPSPKDFAALVTRGTVAHKISRRDSGVSITPIVRLLLDAFVSTVIQRDASSAAQRQSRDEGHITEQLPALQKGWQSRESAIEDIESARNSQILTGKSNEPGEKSTESLPSRLSRSSPCKGAVAECAGVRQSVSGWITATLLEIFGDCSAIPAMQGSVCSEIVSRLFSEHSDTCGIRQRYRLQSGRLVEDVPADDPLNDPSCWPKANPLLGVTITEDYLASVVAQAKNIPSKQNNILRLHFCVWTDSDVAWMSREVVEPLLADFDPVIEHKGKDVFCGLDLSQSRDLTALGCVTQTGEKEVEARDKSGELKKIRKPTFDIWIEAWTPGDTMQERSERDKIPYPIWAQQGFIHAPPGENINYLHVAQTLVEYDRDHSVRMVAYDRYAFRRFEEDAKQLNLSLNFVEHPQGGTKKAKPTPEMEEAAKREGKQAEGLWFPGSLRLLEDAMLEGRVRFRRNPALISAIASAVVEKDKWDKAWLSKQKSTNKIDPIVAVVMAFGAAHSLPVKKHKLVMFSVGR